VASRALYRGLTPRDEHEIRKKNNKAYIIVISLKSKAIKEEKNIITQKQFKIN
jgi:hypothetical protein